MPLVATMPQEIEPKDYLAIRDLVAKTPFSPRKEWLRPMEDVALDGVTCASWTPIGVFIDGKLVSYLDYRAKNGRVKIGLVVTDPDFRGHGLATSLLQYLCQKYPFCKFTSEVSVANRDALQWFKSQGFHVIHYSLVDNPDESDVAHLVFDPLNR